MHLEPVRHYHRPTYPTRVELELNPEELRSLPDRWRGHPVVVAVLATLWSAGCHERGHGDAQDTASAAASSKRPPPSTRAALSKVAPLFEHGQGVASSGGDSGTTMVFLTEDDAMRVVFDEAARAGIAFVRESWRMGLLDLPVTSRSGKPDAFKFGAFKVDGYDDTRKIGFEFVSHEDFEAWGDIPSSSTVETYDMIGTARALLESIDRSSEAATYGVFYDPMANYVAPPLLPEGTFEETTRAPLHLFHPAGDGYRIAWGGKQIRFEVDSRTANVDGKKVLMPAPAVLRDEELYVPVKFVTEALGGTVTLENDRVVRVQIPAAGILNSSSVNVFDFGGKVGRGTVAFQPWDRAATDGPTLARSREELRAQVRDFIAWLKGQGVI